MSRAVRRYAAALLVEGFKDVRLYRNIIDEEACEITATDGKRNALGALRLLRNSGQRGVLTIIDADFSGLIGAQTVDPDVILTDGHDLEGMLVHSPALSKLLIEYDLRPYEFGKSLGDTLARAVGPLGYLRMASLKFGLRLAFDKLDFSVFTKLSPAISIEVGALIKEVVHKNPTCALSEQDLQDMIQGLSDATHHPWAVACGHDLTAVLALLLSTKSGREIQAYTVERQIRLSYEAPYFASTELCARVREWEERNKPYRVLRAM